MGLWVERDEGMLDSKLMVLGTCSCASECAIR